MIRILRRWNDGNGVQTAVLCLSALAVFVALVATAWVGEDALITFRTVDNFVNGYGLRWNIDERVQTYTHQLWMLIIIPFYFFTREVYFTVTALCLVCTVSAFLILARPFRRQPVIVGIILASFFLSRSLVYYGTSGFENPLTLLLLSIFVTTYLRARQPGEVPWFGLSLVAALALTNRMDTLLMYAPALLFLLVFRGRRTACRQILLGFSPLALWLSFSVLYYGFPLPNTAPAKLSSALPRVWYIRSGSWYLFQLFQMDLASGILLSFGVVVLVFCIVRFLRDSGEERSGLLAALGVGMLSYCGYVLWIGGDFMVGRFWTGPLWLSIVLIAYSTQSLWCAVVALPVKRRAVIAGALIGSVALIYGAVLETTRRVFGGVSVGTIRPVAYKFLTSDLTWGITRVGENLERHGTKAREAAENSEEGRVTIVGGAIGFSGLAAGPAVTIIDKLALGDALLARIAPSRRIMVGHLQRRVPLGYVTARSTGSMSEMHPALQQYYAKLRLITSGPLWSLDRFKTIIAFNSGRYDHLLAEYEQDAMAGEKRSDGRDP